MTITQVHLITSGTTRFVQFGKMALAKDFVITNAIGKVDKQLKREQMLGKRKRCPVAPSLGLPVHRWHT